MDLCPFVLFLLAIVVLLLFAVSGYPFGIFKRFLPCLRGVLEFAPSVSNVLIILSTSMYSWSA